MYPPHHSHRWEKGGKTDVWFLLAGLSTKSTDRWTIEHSNAVQYSVQGIVCTTPVERADKGWKVRPHHIPFSREKHPRKTFNRAQSQRSRIFQLKSKNHNWHWLPRQRVWLKRDCGKMVSGWVKLNFCNANGLIEWCDGLTNSGGGRYQWQWLSGNRNGANAKYRDNYLVWINSTTAWAIWH